jgi:hypothetical protein
MAIRQLTDNLSIISALPDEPNDTQGLSADALKAKFDESGNRVKAYVNGVLIPDISETIVSAVSAAELTAGNMPLGGTAGQVLSKASDADLDAAFVDVSEVLTPEALPVSSAAVSRLGLTPSDGQHVDSALKKLAGAAGNYRGTCGTAAETAAKTVSITGFALETGAIVCVTFTYADTAPSPTLNVTGTGDKPIYYAGAPVSADKLVAGLTALLQYDGARWVMLTPGFGNVLTGTVVTGTVSSPALGVLFTVELGAQPKFLMLSPRNTSTNVRYQPFTLIKPELSTQYTCYFLSTVVGGMSGYQTYVTATGSGFSMKWVANIVLGSVVDYYAII